MKISAITSEKKETKLVTLASTTDETAKAKAKWLVAMEINKKQYKNQNISKGKKHMHAHKTQCHICFFHKIFI